MRRLGALCLCLGLAAPALAGTGDPPPAEDSSVPWYSYRYWLLGERTKPKPPAANPAPAARPPAPPKESAKETAAKQLEQEQRVYLQRLQAISKIRQVAVEQNDEATLKRADALEQQAEDVYKQRTAALMSIVEKQDQAALEKGRDDQPATADRSRKRTTGGNN
jgi:hypothetical protein